MSPTRRWRERERLRDPETGEWDVDEVKHRSKGWIAVALALAVIFGGLVFVGTKAWDAWMGFRTSDDYIGAGVDDVDVDVPKGANMTQIGKILQEADVVRSADTFRRYAQSRPNEAAKVQAGTYRMRTQIPARDAFERLLDSEYLVRNMIQLKEGQRLSEQVAAMAEATGLEEKAFTEALKDPAKLGLPAYAGGKAEGFFFPDTYELPSQPDAASVMKIAVDNYKKVTASMDFENRAKASPAKDPYQALIMASLLEREANRQEDRLKVARVFYNRLAQGMPLQSDATVAYANDITGRVWTTDAERKKDSPYNTYLDKNKGKLPPGPVTSPSKAALEAALSPAEGDWLYFVPINLDTGETVFTNNFEEHQAAVARLQQWCQTSDKC